jgi:hypothetical protein
MQDAQVPEDNPLHLLVRDLQRNTSTARPSSQSETAEHEVCLPIRRNGERQLELHHAAQLETFCAFVFRRASRCSVSGFTDDSIDPLVYAMLRVLHARQCCLSQCLCLIARLRRRQGDAVIFSCSEQLISCLHGAAPESWDAPPTPLAQGGTRESRASRTRRNSEVGTERGPTQGADRSGRELR